MTILSRRRQRPMGGPCAALVSRPNRSRPWCLLISTDTAKPGNSPTRARSESLLLTRCRARRIPGGVHDVSGDTHHECRPEQRREQIDDWNGKERRHDKARGKQAKRVIFAQPTNLAERKIARGRELEIAASE